MSTEKLKILDTSCLKKLQDLDREAKANGTVLNRFLDLFYSTAPERISKMDKAVGDGNSQGVLNEAHTLKTNCAYVGAMRMHSVCIQLQDMNDGVISDEGKTLVEQLKTEYTTVEKALKNYQQESGYKKAA